MQEHKIGAIANLERCLRKMHDLLWDKSEDIGPDRELLDLTLHMQTLVEELKDYLG